MNKEIEEMARLMCETCKNDYGSDYECCCETICQGALSNAEALYNAGYRKVIWHKVADGDLPNNKQVVLIACKNVNGEIITDIDQFVYNRFLDVRTVDVIAWTELPRYEGEEK